MATFNYFFVVRALVCQDAINGKYAAKYFVMDKATVATSTKFWHEGMQNATPLDTAPLDAVIPLIQIEGKTLDVLSEDIKSNCQSLAERLTASQVVPLTVTAGTVVPVTINL